MLVKHHPIVRRNTMWWLLIDSLLSATVKINKNIIINSIIQSPI